MKKIIALFLVTILLLSAVPVYANDILGETVYTDIITYINHYPIPSYNFNGNTLIAAEDLQNYGFNVFWNEYARTLTINRDYTKNNIAPECTFRPLESDIGKKDFTVTSTDVKVYTGNYQYSSFGGLNGKTLINLNDLKCIDNVSVVWVPEVKAVKVWINDGLDMLQTPFNVRRLKKDFTYYETCIGFENKWYKWKWLSMPTATFISVGETNGENSDICSDCFGTVEVVDVIDADGNSRLKNQYLYDTNEPTYVPYFYNFSDCPLSHMVIIKNSDLYPNKASDHGGLIKLKYDCIHDNTTEETIRVDCLPYE